jgi:hypothetical protein
MALLHSPGSDRSPLCGLPSTPRTPVLNDPYTFLGVWGRKPERTCSLCIAVLRSSHQFGALFALIDQRVPPPPTP